MLDLLPLELILKIIDDLTPLAQFDLAFTSKRLWWTLKATTDRHRSLAQECALWLQGQHKPTGIESCYLRKPYLMPYVVSYESCPQECPCRIENMKRGAHEMTYSIFCRIPADLSNLSRLELQIPQRSVRDLRYYPIAALLQQLNQVIFWGNYQRLALDWLHLFLGLPNIRIIHGRFMGSHEWACPYENKVPSSVMLPLTLGVKELVITNSILHELGFDISHTPMDIFLYNHVDLRHSNGDDPCSIIGALPVSLKHLAILEWDVQRLYYRKFIPQAVYRRYANRWRDKPRCREGQWVLVKTSSLMHFQQLETLWCFWPTIVPAHADPAVFDLSSVLPKSLTWLVLFSVPREGVEILTRALPKMPRLRLIWAQIQAFYGSEQFFIDTRQEVQITTRFQRTVRDAGLLWAGPEHDSVFSPYMRYLQIHQWPPKK